MADLTLFTHSIDSYTLTVTSEATGYHKEHMQDRRKSTSWRSTTNADQTVDIDAAAALSVDHVLIYHTLPVGTLVQLYGAAAANYSDEVVCAAANIAANNSPVLYLATVDGDGDPLSYSKRYWRVKLSSIPGGQIANISLIFLGAKQTITIRYNYGEKIRDTFKTELFESLAGYRAANSHQVSPRRIWDIAWEQLSKANRDNLITAVTNSQGMRYPVWIQDPDDSLYYYVRLMIDDIADVEVAHQLYNISFRMEEEF